MPGYRRKPTAFEQRIAYQVNGFYSIKNYDDWLGGVMHSLNNGKTELRLSDNVIHVAKSLCEFCYANYNKAYNRAVLSASCLYIACRFSKEPRSQQQISDALHVSKPSIQKHYQKILKLNGIESIIGK
jgi:DNA-binding CsgD family transcriptional regulator